MSDKDPGEGTDSQTFLWIAGFGGDQGVRPMPPNTIAWLSPGIAVAPPSGGLPGDTAEAGGINHIQVTVSNGGGIAAISAFVEAFVSIPSTAFTPQTSEYAGYAFINVQPYSATVADIAWTPSATMLGHRCIVARVSLFLDNYADGTWFDVWGDRHVAQHNITVLDPGPAHRAFGFIAVNPTAEAAVFTLRARGFTDKESEFLMRCGWSASMPRRRFLSAS
jgi:hypothetical protein